MPVQRSHRCRDGLSICRIFNPNRRPPHPRLFFRERESVPMKNGHPQFQTCLSPGAGAKQFEVIKVVASGQRMYKPPMVPPPLARRDFNISNFHEMNANIRFLATGTFYDSGSLMRTELYRICQDLRLVGGFMCGSSTATGHLQGDVSSIGYFRRWLDMRVPTGGGRFKSVRFWGENYGMPELDFKNIIVRQDFRRPAKRLQVEAKHREMIEMTRFFQQGLERQRDFDAFVEANSVREY
eukprot:GHVS01072704.1.p1 GENE.GHVS01072704.1~~GHVS01072704.1.p1  ORF type:complete len:239 (-),score=23.85 GHVS01072704.1:703-1419(-)